MCHSPADTGICLFWNCCFVALHVSKIPCAFDTFLIALSSWGGHNWNQDMVSCLGGKKPFLPLFLSALLFSLSSSTSPGTENGHFTVSKFVSLQFHSQAEVKWLHWILIINFWENGLDLLSWVIPGPVKCVRRIESCSFHLTAKGLLLCGRGQGIVMTYHGT